MNYPTLLKKLQDRFTDPLPGKNAQHLMAPGDPSRYESSLPADVKTACVMLLLYPEDETWHLIYIKRSTQLKDNHSGQISLPGGKLETNDPTKLDGALREVTEEIGLPKEAIYPLGKLTDVYVYVSNFIVHPFVGILDKKPELYRQESEVAEILHIPIDHLQNKQSIKKKDLQVRNITLADVPYYDLRGEVLWGATAMITSEFLALLED